MVRRRALTTDAESAPDRPVREDEGDLLAVEERMSVKNVVKPTSTPRDGQPPDQ